jgi:signal transduction histidine kinase
MVRELDTFAYTVAHDLRAPLRAVHGFGRLLLEGAGEKLDEDERAYLGHVMTAAERMDRLIRDLLAYSRVSREEMRLRPVDLDALVAAAVREVSGEAAGLHADVAVDGPLAPVLAHETMLAQAVLNLLRNAVKFVPAGVTPRVRVRAEEHGGRLRLWVEDNGIGIAPEHQKRLFRIFERLHGSDEYPGTGVGLAIVRRGVERMGGHVGLESAPGVGSRFYIELAKATSEGA